MAVFRGELWAPILVAYFLMHVLIRMAIGDPLTAEEANLMVNATRFEFNYGDSAPLYVWLQHIIFLAFGPSLLAMAALKALVLFTTCVFVNRLVASVAGIKVAWLATLSLAFLPQIVWHSQHQLTGPVLATCFAVILVWTVMRLQRSPTLTNSALCTIVIALGLLSHAGFVWALIAVVLAAVMSVAFRPILLRFAIAATLAVLAIACMPSSVMQSGARQVLDVAPQLANSVMAGEQILTRIYQVYDMLAAGTVFVGILAIGACFTIYRGLRIDTAPDADVVLLRGFLRRTLAIGFVALLLAVAVGLTTQADIALAQPLLVLSAPLVTLYLYPFLDKRSERQILKAAAIIGGLVLLLSPTYYTFAARDGVASEPGQVIIKAKAPV